MTSRTITTAICWVLAILHLTTDMFPGGAIPAAFCGSFIIMLALGFFKREEAKIEVAIDENEGLSQRQIDFKRRLKEGKDAGYQPDGANDLEKIATIVTMDEEGNEATVIIKENGEVITEGNPNPDIVDAAKMLRASVLKHGPDAIAKELGVQLDKIEKSEKHQ